MNNLDFESLPSEIKNSVEYLHDGSKLSFLLPHFGFHNIFHTGLAHIPLITNFFTMATNISIRLPKNEINNILKNNNLSLFVIQSVVRPGEKFFQFFKPFQIWPQLTVEISFVSFYRRFMIYKQELKLKESKESLAEIFTKMATVPVKGATPEALFFIEDLMKKNFSSFHQQPHYPFPEVRHFVSMTSDESLRLIEILEKMDGCYNEKIIVGISNHDWNGHVCNSNYISLSGDAVYKAIKYNNKFKKKFFKLMLPGNQIKEPEEEEINKILSCLKVKESRNNYIKECKFNDLLKIFIYIKNNYIHFVIIKLIPNNHQGNLDDFKTQICYVGEMEVEVNAISKL